MSFHTEEHLTRWRVHEKARIDIFLLRLLLNHIQDARRFPTACPQMTQISQMGMYEQMMGATICANYVICGPVIRA